MNHTWVTLVVIAFVVTGCGRPIHKPFVAQDNESQKVRQELQPYFEHPENIDYAVVKKYVIEKCQGCHSLDSSTKDINAITYSANLTNYASLFNNFTPVIVKGAPSDSKLFQSIAITQSMPPAAKGYDPMDSMRTKILRLWILNCAIESKAALPDEVLTPNPDLPEKVRACAAP